MLRCVGPQQEVRPFQTFAMVALAAIGDCLPETVLDRSVVIRMRRRAPAERVDSFAPEGMPCRCTTCGTG